MTSRQIARLELGGTVPDAALLERLDAALGSSLELEL